MFTLNWIGWTTTWEELKFNGWEITEKPKFNSWYDPINSEASHKKIYIRHKETRMIARLRENYIIATGTLIYKIDFLTHERNHRIKPHPIYTEAELTEADIPKLYSMILDIQSRRSRKNKIVRFTNKLRKIA